MRKKHYAIIVPGLGDLPHVVRLLTWHWKLFGITPIIHIAPWKGKETFKPKLTRLVHYIDQLSQGGNGVSLVGMSAGGGIVVNAFYQRKGKVNAVVNISGRLQIGKDINPSLDKAAFGYPAFKECIIMCDEIQKKLKQNERKRVLTIRGIFDEIVPLSTIHLEGGKNIQIPAVEHNVTIAMALVFYAKKITNFLKQKTYD